MYEQNYRKAREKAGVRAERAAAKLGVSITTLFSWERGNTSPTASKLVEMAELYGVSVNRLLALE
jgi:HTH-type transcriptional regulator/antitoxin HipB